MSKMEQSSLDEEENYNKAVKSVITKQLKELIQQLEDSGSEVAVIGVDLEDSSCCYFGTAQGESFIEQNELESSFFEFCKSNSRLQTDSQTDSHVEKTPSPPTPAVEEKTSTAKEPPKRTSERRFSVKAVPVKPATAPPDGTSDVLKFDIPEKYTVGMSENEVAGLVGRIVAAQLVTTKQRGDTAGSTKKFKTLLDVANNALKKEKGSAVETSPVKPPPSTPGSTRSGRKVSSKFLESINSLKKHSKGKEENQEGENLEESTKADADILEEITSIDASVMKRVRVKSIDGKLIDLQLTTLTHTTEVENLAIILIHELDLVVKKHPIFSSRFIKVMLTSEDNTPEAIVKAVVVKADWSLEASKTTDSRLQKSSGNDSVNLEELCEGEVNDLQDDLGEFYKDMSSLGDPDFNPVGQVKKAVKKGALNVSKVPQQNNSPSGLIRKPKARHYTETMPVECQHCGITLTGRSNLKSHIKRVHMHIRNFKCSICRRAFWSNNALESHMLSVHTRQCEACQEYVVESVPWGNGLTMRTRRDVICTCGSIVSICSTFGRKRIYLRDDEPDEDGNIYQKRPKNNTGTKYACGTCGKLFMKKSNCERHSRKHTDVKSCVCNVCGTAYMYESSLKKHMATEHGVVRHVCEICQGNYATLTALKVHIVKAHRNVTLDEDDVAYLMKRKVAKQEIESHEEMEEDMEEMMEHDGEPGDEPEIIVNGSSGEVIVHHKGQGILNKIDSPNTGASHDQSIVISESTVIDSEQGDQVILSQAEELTSTEGHIVVNQDGHIVVSSDGTDQTTAQLVQQVINGQVVGQNGEMSIIIKQIPIENEIY